MDVPLLTVGFPDTGVGIDAWAIFFLILAGAFGALAKELLDGNLTLPTIKMGILDLGFISGILLGGIAGGYLGGSVLGAFTTGLTVNAFLQSLIKKVSSPSEQEMI